MKLHVFTPVISRHTLVGVQHSGTKRDDFLRRRMKILVTGAAGFIGSHLSERLVGLGHEVLGVDCFTDFYSRELKEMNVSDIKDKGVKFYELDLVDDDLSNIISDVEVVYHMAAQPGISKTVGVDKYVRKNIFATNSLVSQLLGVISLRCFVFASTSSIYGKVATGDEESIPKPTSFYGVTKLAAEQLVLAYHRDKGFPACSIRLFSVYGERERPEKIYPRLTKSILDGTEFPLREGSEKHERSYTYISDIVDGLVLVLDHIQDVVGEVIILGSDKVTTTGENIKIIEDVLGKKAKIVMVPKQPGDQEKTKANISKAMKILRYKPKVLPKEGLRREALWYKTRIWNKVSDLSFSK